MSSTALGPWNGVAISKSGQYAIGLINGGQIYYSNNTSVTTVSKDLTEVFEPLYKYKTWASTGGSNTFSGISCSNDGKYVVACIKSTTGLIYYSNNYCASWLGPATVNNNTAVPEWYGISMSNTGQYAVACQNTGTGSVFFSSNYGATWNVSTNASSLAGWFLACSISSSGKYAIISKDTGITAPSTNHDGKVYYSSNATDVTPTWTLSNLTTVFSLNIALSGNGKYGILCAYQTSGSGIWISSTFGASWTKHGSYTTTTFAGCAISASGKYAIISSLNGKIYYSNNFCSTWIESNSQSRGWQKASMSDSGQYCIVCGGGGDIVYSNDYGATWTNAGATDGTTPNITICPAISKNGQYAFLTTQSGTMYRCMATNSTT